MPSKLLRSEEQWRSILSPDQFHILREKGTELRSTENYDKLYKDNIHNWVAAEHLYTSLEPNPSRPAAGGLPSSTPYLAPSTDLRRQIDHMCCSCGWIEFVTAASAVLV